MATIGNALHCMKVYYDHVERNVRELTEHIENVIKLTDDPLARTEGSPVSVRFRFSVQKKSHPNLDAMRALIGKLRAEIERVDSFNQLNQHLEHYCQTSGKQKLAIFYNKEKDRVGREGGSYRHPSKSQYQRDLAYVCEQVFNECLKRTPDLRYQGEGLKRIIEDVQRITHGIAGNIASNYSSLITDFKAMRQVIINYTTSLPQDKTSDKKRTLLVKIQKVNHFFLEKVLSMNYVPDRPVIDTLQNLASLPTDHMVYTTLAVELHRSDKTVRAPRMTAQISEYVEVH